MFFVFLIFTFAISQELDEGKPYTVYVKQSGSDTNTGTEIDQEKKSLKSAYDLLGDDEACKIFIVNDATALTAQQISFSKSSGITIEGVDCKGIKNEIVAIDCDMHPNGHLFTCENEVEFKYLAFHFPISLSESGYGCLIYGYLLEFKINHCQFIRPPSNGRTVNYTLMELNVDNLYVDNVECVDESRVASFSSAVFGINAIYKVSFTNVTLKKISSDSSIVSIRGLEKFKLDVILNCCTFSECQTISSAVLYVSSSNSESTFTVGDGGVTSFTSCSGGKIHSTSSGGIYLHMTNITSASQLKWPTDGKNLIFQNCAAYEGSAKVNTGLFLEMKNDSLFKDIADAMKASFAVNYTRKENLWYVVGFNNKSYSPCDFTSLYFDPPPTKPDNMTRAFVKNGGRGNGIDINSAINSIYDAYDFLEKNGKCFIDVVKTSDPIKAEAISFNINSGITIEGVNDKGEGNAEVAIDCNVSVSSFLFSCQRIVEFKYLAFQFFSTEKNWDSLISAGSGSISLKISTCRFVRIGSQTQEGMNSNADGDSPLESSLVSVTSGTVEMDTVKCTDETSFVTFSSSPFSFSGASEVSLSNVDISKVNVESGAAISIDDGSNSFSKVSIEGLNMSEVKSEKGAAAGLDITLSSEESRVAIGRSSKCSFKSCSAPEGKSGAIFIDMPKATSNLQLPSEHNLEIDSSNTAGSKTTSLFIIAPDFEEFCKQEDAFEFANDYDESTFGWIEGAKDAESEPEDVYEKNIKGKKKKPIDNPEDQTKDEKKTNTGVIVVAIVVPIVVVVGVVVIVIVVVIVRKKRSRNEENDEKELEMND
ncbi:uncharacterized protein MONOS_2351 [Monocercomonoides exilis]|uniref:uncharacterized protein n=1 Tax=Monocercomonoides exilis TaxID=2049356 RepID=UPI003559C202|nr:hypothetical protein MONOS_2351 [Monocercomonoides exilis]|eukprot:MONOS_2351.1-p1 / transcript=MONOS_2351.1 / gene=MONOS_2351 / organism=Monocercomonoides_exilis_PA203 / gene_product=unspecified product / transcript_product=unspecified product / location=Mono_scaffold00048:55624-58080(-) / protein_length=819 / sequence_SO=supercontig / SO=protein_coding / is_pseudo=false